jgi:hypothetical protein
MRKSLAIGTCLSLVLALTPAALLAQTPAPGTSVPPATSPAPRTNPPTSAPSEPASVEGTVKRVDPSVNQIQVSSGLFGLFGRTVNVTSDTDIHVEGRKATLADIREGSRAKVAYETRDGRNVARSIEVMAEPRESRPSR